MAKDKTEACRTGLADLPNRNLTSLRSAHLLLCFTVCVWHWFQFSSLPPAFFQSPPVKLQSCSLSCKNFIPSWARLAMLPTSLYQEPPAGCSCRIRGKKICLQALRGKTESDIMSVCMHIATRAKKKKIITKRVQPGNYFKHA